MAEKIVGYMTVRFPIVEQHDTGDWEHSTPPSTYYDLGEHGAEVTFDTPDDIVKSVAITDATGLLYEGTRWQEDVTAALETLVPNVDEFLEHRPGEMPWERATRFAALSVVRPGTDGPAAK